MVVAVAVAVAVAEKKHKNSLNKTEALAEIGQMLRAVRVSGEELAPLNLVSGEASLDESGGGAELSHERGGGGGALTQGLEEGGE